MHEYRRLVRRELDARGWKAAELEKRSGLSRQLISKLLSDKRSHLGQMPEDSTMERIAHGFGIPVERVRLAAARSLARYEDDGAPLATDLRGMSIDVLLTEIRRRVVAASVDGSEPLAPPPHFEGDDADPDAAGDLGEFGSG